MGCIIDLGPDRLPLIADLVLDHFQVHPLEIANIDVGASREDVLDTINYGGVGHVTRPVQRALPVQRTLIIQSELLNRAL